MGDFGVKRGMPSSFYRLSLCPAKPNSRGVSPVTETYNMSPATAVEQPKP
jgi:hypothetical protein